jgi:hypothetical protein
MNHLEQTIPALGRFGRQPLVTQNVAHEIGRRDPDMSPANVDPYQLGQVRIGFQQDPRSTAL